jgi:DNA invertase Pin-like site-specific DNA recombinase
MKKNNQPPLHVELIPSPATLHRERTGFDKAELTRLVQEKVAEIMAERDAIVFEPFFRSRQVAYELKRLQNIPEQQKFTVSFERYGCMICETRERIHGGNGMCTLCHAKWFARLTQIIAEGIKGEPARTARGAKLDQRLLPHNGIRDGVHQTWYERSNAKEQSLYKRVAEKLDLTRDYVREVAHGSPPFRIGSCCASRRKRARTVMRVAIYARVSTANNGQDPTMQTRELREYAERRGWTVASEYVDIGISGTKETRPQLDRLMADAHRRRFDAVVVWKFDRFARSVSHLLRALETFKAQGIEFVSFSEQLDTSTPAGKLVFTVLGAVAELERSLIVERVKAGLRNARAKGKKLGRPRVYPDQHRIAALRAEGLSWAKIAERLSVGEGTVYRTAHATAKIRLRVIPATGCEVKVE